MNDLQIIKLHNGTVLQAREGMVICSDPDGSRIHLTYGQQRMLAILMHKINCQVSMSELYEGYSGNAVLVDDKGIRENVTKMKNTLPACIKRSLKSVRGYGYMLTGIQEQEAAAAGDAEERLPAADTTMLLLSELAGDYYGFYLDPLGSGAVLTSYIHIENTGTSDTPDMAAYVIWGIRDKTILLGSDISQVFQGHHSQYHSAYLRFRKTLGDNDKRCAWLQGSLSLDGTLAYMHLSKVTLPGTWTFILDIKEYIQSGRTWENENSCYRGGLGLAVALNTAHGSFCLRLGLVRKSHLTSAMLQDSEELKGRLKIADNTNDAMWKPLKLSRWLDKLWYDWIMNG